MSRGPRKSKEILEAEARDRAIRKERREQKRKEKEARRVAREAKRTARESYDAKNGGDYAMKLSHFSPSLGCRGCGRSIPEHWVPGRGPVCSDCLSLFDVDGRATPAEPGTAAVGSTVQLALFES